MMRKNILENRLTSLFEEYEAATRQLQKSLDAVTQLRLKRQIADIEDEIRQVKNALDEIPLDSAQSIATEFQLAFDTLHNAMPKHIDSLSKLVWIFAEFGNLYDALNEWKEAHNLLQECLTALSPLKDTLICNLESPYQWDKTRGKLLWHSCELRFRNLEEFACNIGSIDKPLSKNNEAIEGPRWMIMITTQKSDLIKCLDEGDYNATYDSTLELWHYCYTALYKADKQMRNLIAEIYMISKAILRVVENEKYYR